MLHVELAPDILAPDIERRLVEVARAEGLEPDGYASRLIASMIAARTAKNISRKRNWNASWPARRVTPTKFQIFRTDLHMREFLPGP